MDADNRDRNDRSDRKDRKDRDLNWLDEFETMAEKELHQGSACKQIHPIVEGWLEEWLDSDLPEPRSSVSQALACLATEIMSNAPDSVLNALTENCEEDEVFQWIQGILITGQAFQDALKNGRLDDL
jgi:hypothetical protein